MIRKFLDRLRPGFETDLPAPAEPVEGLDFELYTDHDAHANMAGRRSFVVALRDPTGFLTRETYDAIKQEIRPASDEAEALQRISRWRPHAMDAQEKQELADEVNKIVKLIGRRQQHYLSGKDGLGKLFFNHLLAAMKEHGTTDGVALLEQLNELPSKVRDQFNATELDALSHASILEGAIAQAKGYLALRTMSANLRNEAVNALGEEVMRPRTMTAEPQGARSTSNRTRFIPRNKSGQWVTGGGMVRTDSSGGRE